MAKKALVGQEGTGGQEAGHSRDADDRDQAGHNREASGGQEAGHREEGLGRRTPGRAAVEP